MGAARRPTTLREMNEVLADHVAWRRKSIRHQYVGRLEALGDRIRLIGRVPELGIDVALSIPFEQITRIRAGHGAGEGIFGARGIVLELGSAEPIFLRELGDGTGPTRLLRLLDRRRPGAALRAAHA
jgi:hypothetical protein